MGDGTTSDRTSPVAVSTNVTFDSIAVGIARACTLTRDGTAYCWGANLAGELGTTGPVANCDGYGCGRTPQPVTGAYRFRSITAGSGFMCGDTAGGVFCWGENDAWELGTGTQNKSVVPVRTAGPALHAIDAGPDHSCGLDAEGNAWCWGSDWRGRIGGGGEQMHAPSPAKVVNPVGG